MLEITETQLLGDAADSASRFEELRDLGVRIALDDFGTGYSSLSYLHSLPLTRMRMALQTSWPVGRRRTAAVCRRPRWPSFGRVPSAAPPTTAVLRSSDRWAPRSRR